MSWSIVLDFLICLPATVFFAVLLRVPRRAIPACAVLGGLGYAAYECAMALLGSTIAGFFLGTLLMAALSEVLARVMRMPATIFIIPAIIPLVPGLGLYQTMNYFVHGQNAQAGQVGTATILAITAMAMAMVMVSLFTNTLLAGRKNRKK